MGENGKIEKLIVPETGIYYLYNQVGFLVYNNPEEELDVNGSQTLFHEIYRSSLSYATGREILLKSTSTQCWEKLKDYGRYTSYVGSAVALNRDDALYVTASSIENVAWDEPLSFFGLFKISY